MAGDHKRLGILRDFLRVLPMHDSKGRQRFDMNSWSSGKFEGVGYDALTKCGTAGCAYGWATRIPEFRDLGWKLDHSTEMIRGKPMWSEPTIEGEDASESAGMEFFNISGYQQERIIMPMSYKGLSDDITPQMVADRIQEIMDE